MNGRDDAVGLVASDGMTVSALVTGATDIFGAGTGDAGAPFVVWSPGRVNLIGDHIDYSGGLVLPMALDRGTTAVVLPRSDDLLRGYSTNFPDSGLIEARLADTAFDPARGWFSYVLAVVDTAISSGLRVVHGFDIHLTGSIPDGGGLSSSASVELAVSMALEHQFGFGLNGTQWALLSQRAENGYIGVASGIMDQLAIAEGRDGMAILMDCQTLGCTYVPMPTDRCTVVIANTRHRRELADSAYNERRAAVDTAHRILDQVLPAPLPNLVSASQSDLTTARPQLEAAGVWREARHSVGEQQRVVAAADALAAGDLRTMGRLMRASHESLRDDFRVTGEYLDALADAAWDTPGVIGARMTGAGFGGCTVNLIEPDAVDEAVAGIARRYSAATGITPEIFAVRPSSGAHVVGAEG